MPNHAILYAEYAGTQQAEGAAEGADYKKNGPMERVIGPSRREGFALV
jgi:hypothetical protein